MAVHGPVDCRVLASFLIWQKTTVTWQLWQEKKWVWNHPCHGRLVAPVFPIVKFTYIMMLGTDIMFCYDAVRGLNHDFQGMTERWCYDFSIVTSFYNWVRCVNFTTLASHNCPISPFVSGTCEPLFRRKGPIFLVRIKPAITWGMNLPWQEGVENVQ